MTFSLDYYRIFYQVGKAGSFTQAARLLDNNQPNITRTINNLETALGCRLFVRSHKGVTFTPEGEKLFAHIEVALREIALAEAEITAEQNLQSGHLSLALTEIGLRSFMLPVLQRFRLEHPGIHIQVRNCTTPEGIRSIEKDQADLAVLSSPIPVNPALKKEILASFQDILIAGRSFSAYEGREVSLKELSSLPFITLGRDTSSFLFLQDFFSLHGLLLEPSIEAATTDQVLPMVEHDIGLGFVPESFAKEALGQGRVLRLRLQDPLPARQLCLIRRGGRPLSAAARVLLEMILAVAKEAGGR